MLALTTGIPNTRLSSIHQVLLPPKCGLPTQGNQHANAVACFRWDGEVCWQLVTLRSRVDVILDLSAVSTCNPDMHLTAQTSPTV